MRYFAYRHCVQCGGKLTVRKDTHGDTRSQCRRCGAVEYQNPKPTAGLILICAHELLLVKRARSPFKGWWDLPGGFVERGEAFETALAREVREELGIELGNFIFVRSTPDIYREGEPTLNAYFMKRVARKPLMHPADDVVQAQWFLFHALPSRIAFAGQRKVVREFIRRI